MQQVLDQLNVMFVDVDVKLLLLEILVNFVYLDFILLLMEDNVNHVQQINILN